VVCFAIDEIILTPLSTMNLKEYKRREFLGDRLLGFVVGELLGDNWRKSHDYVNNDNLSDVAKRIGLIPHPLDIKHKKQAFFHQPKEMANAYEAYIYSIYESDGIEAVKEFVKKTLVK
jgi:dsRNA-specific ribonuclease